MTCGHPLTAIVRDSAKVEVCSLCSPDVTTPSTVRPQRPRRCWEHPPGTVVTRKPE